MDFNKFGNPIQIMCFLIIDLKFLSKLYVIGYIILKYKLKSSVSDLLLDFKIHIAILDFNECGSGRNKQTQIHRINHVISNTHIRFMN